MVALGCAAGGSGSRSPHQRSAPRPQQQLGEPPNLHRRHAQPHHKETVLAGALDGDGSTSIRRKQLTFVQSSVPYLQALRDITMSLPGTWDAADFNIYHGHDNNANPGFYNQGSSSYHLVITGAAAVTLATMLAPHVIKKVKKVCKIAGVAPPPNATWTSLCRQRLCPPYVGSFFDAEGSVFFRHVHRYRDMVRQKTYTYLCVNIAQSSRSFNKHLSNYLWRAFGANFSFSGCKVYASSIRAVQRFYDTIVLRGFSLRKGWKLFAIKTAWFSDAAGRLKSLRGWPIPNRYNGLDALPSFPSSGQNGCEDVHPYSVLASRSDSYLQHGPVQCEHVGQQGIRPIRVGGRIQRIPGLWSSGRTSGYALMLNPRPHILATKATFAQ